MKKLILTLAASAFLVGGCSKEQTTYTVSSCSGEDSVQDKLNEGWKVVTSSVAQVYCEEAFCVGNRCLGRDRTGTETTYILER